MDAYEARELARHRAHVEACAAAPLAERQEARADFRSLLLDLEYLQNIACQVRHGDYGKGSHLLYEQIASAGKRSNKIAAFGQLIAVVECRCPTPFAVDAWKSLTPAEQTAANNVLAAVLEGDSDD
jgi:hypothetical protein